MNHHQTVYQNSSSRDIEEALVPILKAAKGKSVFDSLKMRRLEHPLMETSPFTPAHPILFKDEHVHLLERLHGEYSDLHAARLYDDEDEGDDDDDESDNGDEDEGDDDLDFYDSFNDSDQVQYNQCNPS